MTKDQILAIFKKVVGCDPNKDDNVTIDELSHDANMTENVLNDIFGSLKKSREASKPAPVPPKPAPVPPKAAPVPPKAAPVPPKAAPVPPKPAPVPPKAAPVPPKAAPVPPKPVEPPKAVPSKKTKKTYRK